MKSMFANWLRDATTRSPSLLAAYARIMTARARAAEARGDRLTAVERVLRGWRAAGTELMGIRTVAWAEQLLADSCGNGQTPLAQNRLLAEFVDTTAAKHARRWLGAWPNADRVRFRGPRPDDNTERQGDLIILKEDDERTGERGVLLAKYTEVIGRLPAMFDLAALASRYQLVLEPSWWGYQDVYFHLYRGHDLCAVVFAPWRPDYEYLRSLHSNLIATRLGAGDWVDPEAFRPSGSSERTYDLVMVSSWNPLKRHKVLFGTLAQLRRNHQRTLRVALIGYPLGWTKDHIAALARRYGVLDMCTVFDSVSHEEVARIVADSRAYVLMSLREGANKALYESLFCDTPAVVFRTHRGVNVEFITSDAGVLAEENGLAEALLEVLDPSIVRRPREYALEHTGWPRATETLNTILKEAALARGWPWTRDIVAKKNAPGLRYAERGRGIEFERAYRRLGRFLLPVA